MTKEIKLTPAPIIRQLTLPMTKGGAQGEVLYAEFHKQAATQPLKKKYRVVR